MLFGIPYASAQVSIQNNGRNEMSRAHKVTTSKVLNDYLQHKHINVLKMWINDLRTMLSLTKNRHERINILKEIYEFKDELNRVALG